MELGLTPEGYDRCVQFYDALSSLCRSQTSLFVYGGEWDKHESLQRFGLYRGVDSNKNILYSLFVYLDDWEELDLHMVMYILAVATLTGPTNTIVLCCRRLLKGTQVDHDTGSEKVYFDVGAMQYILRQAWQEVSGTKDVSLYVFCADEERPHAMFHSFCYMMNVNGFQFHCDETFQYHPLQSIPGEGVFASSMVTKRGVVSMRLNKFEEKISKFTENVENTRAFQKPHFTRRENRYVPGTDEYRSFEEDQNRREDETEKFVNRTGNVAQFKNVMNTVRRFYNIKDAKTGERFIEPFFTQRAAMIRPYNAVDAYSILDIEPLDVDFQRLSNTWFWIQNVCMVSSSDAKSSSVLLSCYIQEDVLHIVAKCGDYEVWELASGHVALDFKYFFDTLFQTRMMGRVCRFEDEAETVKGYLWNKPYIQFGDYFDSDKMSSTVTTTSVFSEGFIPMNPLDAPTPKANAPDISDIFPSSVEHFHSYIMTTLRLFLKD